MNVFTQVIIPLEFDPRYCRSSWITNAASKRVSTSFSKHFDNRLSERWWGKGDGSYLITYVLVGLNRTQPDAFIDLTVYGKARERQCGNAEQIPGN